jgi:hypothetical protein
LSLWLLTATAWAQPVRVYRCIDAQGQVSLQDRPCPPGSEQRRRDLPRPPPAQAEAAAPEAEAAPGAGAAAESSQAPSAPPPSRPPPPPLWRCTNWKDEVRDSETGFTQPRCIPISVLRSDIAITPSSAGLCQWVEDDCRQLHGDALCRRWREKLDETERELRFAASDRAAGLRAGTERIDTILRDSCPR